MRMPLLGRHKSPSGGSNQNGDKQQPQQTINRLPVCESPLFGTRRQLPINSPTIHQTTAAAAAAAAINSPANKSPSSNNQHVDNNNNNNNQSNSPTSMSDHQKRLQGPPSSSSTTSSSSSSSINTSQADAIGSVPQNITRQQIHYAFSIMDTNSDGLIDLRDLSQMLANLGVPIDEAILSHVMSTVSKRGEYQHACDYGLCSMIVCLSRINMAALCSSEGREKINKLEGSLWFMLFGCGARCACACVSVYLF